MNILLRVVYDQAGTAGRTEKGSEMLPDGAILGKKGSWINGPA